MKREIICISCAEIKPRGINKDDNLLEIALSYEQNECTKRIFGKLRQSCFCDRCAISLYENDRVCAESTYTKFAPYFEWEKEYICII